MQESSTLPAVFERCSEIVGVSLQCSVLKSSSMFNSGAEENGWLDLNSYGSIKPELGAKKVLGDITSTDRSTWLELVFGIDLLFCSIPFVTSGFQPISLTVLVCLKPLQKMSPPSPKSPLQKSESLSKEMQTSSV